MKIYSYFLIGITLFLVSSCKQQKTKSDKNVYPIIKVELANDTLTSAYSAHFTGKEIVEIRPQVQGKITKICIKEGEEVKQGQVLFIIDQVPYQAALKVAEASVKTAKAKLSTAKLNLESNQSLQSNQIISDFQVKTSINSVAEAEAVLAEAQAQAENARNNLSYTLVKSPVSGRASMIPWHVGALVNSQIATPLVTVSDDSQIYAYFSIAETDAMEILSLYGSMKNYIAQAPAVELEMANGEVYSKLGKIDAVSGIVDETTGAVTLRVVFPNEQHFLHNGGNGKIRMPHLINNKIKIPQAATYELQNKIFVYKVVDGKTQSTPIEILSQNNGTEYIVTNGLNPGDSIIAEGAGLLKNGIDVVAKQ